jgi:hypothetical protein
VGSGTCIELAGTREGEPLCSSLPGECIDALDIAIDAFAHPEQHAAAVRR